MPMQLEPQHTLDLHAPSPKRRPKRKPSARPAFRLEEIPVVAEAMTGTYALRDQLLFRCNTVWGLRAHEQLGMTVGDICHPDGALKDSFVIGSHRLKGASPRHPLPPSGLIITPTPAIAPSAHSTMDADSPSPSNHRPPPSPDLARNETATAVMARCRQGTGRRGIWPRHPRLALPQTGHRWRLAGHLPTAILVYRGRSL